ncbi:MAG: PhzF family phenazine biosynthesis protein [Flavobacteriaceae bacterium]|jgi:PhzF family phenazine biosynthesis protein
MEFKIYQIDAFTDEIFEGNPACIVPLDEWLPDHILLKISKENAVSETAFFIDKGGKVDLRWFTSEIEMDLCGHATLAAAHCLKTILNYKDDKVIFKTLSGELKVLFQNDMYYMNFPSRMPFISELPKVIKKALNIQPREVFKSRDYILIYDSEQEIKNIKIDRQIFDQINLDPGGLVVTAKGEECDFVSRFFTSQSTIFEDPVTGSSHCSLIPFWSKRLKKNKLNAIQISDRKGVLNCKNMESRVVISGKARTYSKGIFFIK